MPCSHREKTTTQVNNYRSASRHLHTSSMMSPNTSQSHAPVLHQILSGVAEMPKTALPRQLDSIWTNSKAPPLSSTSQSGQTLLLSRKTAALPRLPRRVLSGTSAVRGRRVALPKMSSSPTSLSAQVSSCLFRISFRWCFCSRAKRLA